MIGKIKCLVIIIIFAITTSCSFFESNIIDGYTNKVSYNPGEVSEIFINSKEENNKAKILLYNVNGEKVGSISTKIFPQDTNQTEPWKNGFMYKPTFKYEIPNLPSGIYFWEKKIPFVVKSVKKKKITIVYPSNTVAAYCASGGKCFYANQSSENKAADILSFLRPQDFPKFSMPFFKWIEQQTEYDCNYISDMDLDDAKNFNSSEILLVVGHNEYWTKKARQNFDSFVDKGGHAIILSGNTMWWQVRYSEDRSQIHCFKDFDKDPINDSLLKTINWFDERLKYSTISSIGSDFRHGGYGNRKDHGWDGYKILQPNSPLFESTGLKKGEVLSLPTTEYDGAPVTLNKDSFPTLDLSLLNLHKVELLGFDFGERGGTTIGTFIVLKKHQNSGIIINTGSTDWCSGNGIGGKDEKKIKAITKNMINKLLNNYPVFTN